MDSGYDHKEVRAAENMAWSRGDISGIAALLGIIAHLLVEIRDALHTEDSPEEETP